MLHLLLRFLSGLEVARKNHQFPVKYDDVVVIYVICKANQIWKLTVRWTRGWSSDGNFAQLRYKPVTVGP